MSKFKVGDKVRYVEKRRWDTDLTIGKEYPLVNINEEIDANKYLTLMVVDDKGNGQKLYEDQVELVEPPKEMPEKENTGNYWNWEVEETETSLVFKVNGRQVYKATRATNKTQSDEN